jgi:hypothetical protein
MPRSERRLYERLNQAMDVAEKQEQRFKAAGVEVEVRPGGQLNLTPEKVDEILDRLEATKTPKQADEGRVELADELAENGMADIADEFRTHGTDAALEAVAAEIEQLRQYPDSDQLTGNLEIARERVEEYRREDAERRRTAGDPQPIETPEQAEKAAAALARWGRENADQEFSDLDALEAYMTGAIIAQVEDPDYESAAEGEQFNG